ncbi:MAG TPA: ABC transporter ATP-binding protein [Candidatus Thermoplasmatota archaeon]
MAPSALAVKGLSKSFDGLQAVDDLSFEVERGEVFGFLGPNGAGKSTTIKMVLGLVQADGGAVEILGRDLAREPHEIKRRLGYLPERVAFYNNLTALQTLEFYARLKGHGREGLRDLLASVGLQEFADKRVGTFSKGMAQLLGVAQALIGEPELLILDEPTTGLDPNWARQVKDRVKEVNARGTTVFFSSHILSEVQELAGRVAILSRGRLVALDSVSHLQAAASRKPQLRLTIGAARRQAMELLARLPGVEDLHEEGFEVVLSCAPETRTQVLAALANGGVAVQDFRTVDASLEDVFLQYAGNARQGVR